MCRVHILPLEMNASHRAPHVYTCMLHIRMLSQDCMQTRRGSSSDVSKKCPKWFEASCISQPLLLVLRLHTCVGVLESVHIHVLDYNCMSHTMSDKYKCAVLKQLVCTCTHAMATKHDMRKSYAQATANQNTCLPTCELKSKQNSSASNTALQMQTYVAVVKHGQRWRRSLG
jgi:uncharacterized membrane protein YhdT